MSDDPLLLVFTDMDGTLLDHHDYTWEPAAPMLAWLEKRGIPVIPATSKTRSEVEELRGALGNRHPFIVENGAAIYIPLGYFQKQPAATRERESYWVCELSPPRECWLETLQALEADFAGEFTCFHRIGVEGIAQMTGLSLEDAALANRREYSEPVSWRGTEARRREFVAALSNNGANPLQGGRFLSVAGACDKGRALAWLRSVFRAENGGAAARDLAAGDSGNDSAMLEEAGTALAVKSPVHGYPQICRTHDVIYSTRFGPAGWAEGVGLWLSAMGLTGAPT